MLPRPLQCVRRIWKSMYLYRTTRIVHAWPALDPEMFANVHNATDYKPPWHKFIFAHEKRNNTQKMILAFCKNKFEDDVKTRLNDKAEESSQHINYL